MFEENKNMLGQGLSLLKTLIRSSLDNYVLPGTLTGTEILLIYMSQWKRDMLLLTSATLHLISSQPDRITTPERENESTSPE